MYNLRIRKTVEKLFHKLSKKNSRQFEIIEKKVNEIRLRPDHYKNLKAPLQHLKRVHIDKSFVLTFSVDETNKTIFIEDFDHHDNIYNH